MANYYTNFSFGLTCTDAQATQIKDILNEYEKECEAEDGYGCVPFSCEFQPENDKSGEVFIWIHSGYESGDQGAVIDFLCRVLEKFPALGPIGFTWADTCSKPRLDSFGGGAAFVTAHDQFEVFSTDQWITEQAGESVKV